MINGTVLVNVGGVECSAVFEAGELIEVGSDNGQAWADAHAFEITDAIQASQADAEEQARYDDHRGMLEL